MRLLTTIGLKYYETTSLHRWCLEGSRKCFGVIWFAAVSSCRNAVGQHDGKIQKPRISFASLGSHFWDLSKFGSTTPSLNAWSHLLTCIHFHLDTYILTPIGYLGRTELSGVEQQYHCTHMKKHKREVWANIAASTTSSHCFMPLYLDERDGLFLKTTWSLGS